MDPENVDIKRSDVNHWLQGLQSYTMSRGSIRKVKKGSRIPVYAIGDMMDIDLMDMQAKVKENRGMRFILIAIDVFSRFLWTRPLKSKKAEDIIVALKSIFEEPPEVIRTDGGSEFTNRSVQGFFRVHSIYHYVTQSEHKAYYAERVIKTLRSLMSRFMIQENTHVWVNVLSKLTANYNATFHSSIGMSPGQVSVDNEDQVWANQVLVPYLTRKQRLTSKREKNNTVRKPPYKVKIGDHVRISYKKRAFERVYDSKFSGEVFVVAKRYRRQGRPVYQLRDLLGELLKGTFYNYEIQKVRVKSNPKYTIENVLKTKTVRGKKMSFVKWLYYPKKFNSWIESSQVKKMKGMV